MLVCFLVAIIWFEGFKLIKSDHNQMITSDDKRGENFF